MQKLIIEVNSKSWDFLNSLDVITKQIESWFISWNDENNEENYNFEIIKKINATWFKIKSDLSSF